MVNEFSTYGTQPAAALSAHEINRQVRRMERPYAHAYAYGGHDYSWGDILGVQSNDTGSKTSDSFWLELLLALAMSVGGGDE